MQKPKKKSKRKIAGLPPGSIVFTGNQKVEKVFIHYLQYDQEQLEEATYDNHTSLTIHQSPDTQIDWYDVRGLHDTQLIETLGQMFQIHSLILEDVADVHQRPKYEEYDRGNFISLKALSFDRASCRIKTEQVTLYFRTGLVLTFQETESDLFQSVRQRIYNSGGKIRQRKADYLAYAIVDALVDHYYIILENMEEVVEDIEFQLLSQPENEVKERIHSLRKELLIMRKSIAPLREAISRFAKSESDFVEEHTVVFIRDLFDHTIQITDMLETYRDTLNGLQDLYLSEISFKMNQVMQVLTIITTLFVPLSFLAGLYGMNFDHMPELHYKYGYFVLLILMVIISICLLLFFKKKKWL